MGNTSQKGRHISGDDTGPYLTANARFDTADLIAAGYRVSLFT